MRLNWHKGRQGHGETGKRGTWLVQTEDGLGYVCQLRTSLSMTCSSQHRVETFVMLTTLTKPNDEIPSCCVLVSSCSVSLVVGAVVHQNDGGCKSYFVDLVGFASLSCVNCRTMCRMVIMEGLAASPARTPRCVRGVRSLCR